MVQALVSAKKQSVKEIKKRASIKRRNRLLVKIILLSIVLILIALILNKILVNNKYSFVDDENNINFSSTGIEINEGFEKFGQDDNFILIFNNYYNDQNYLSSVIEGLVFSQSMLSAKNKNTVLLISVVDEKNNLLYCQSNKGDLLENAELTRDECLAIIDDNKSIIMVNYPFSTVTHSEVVLNLEDKLLLINPKSSKAIYHSLYISLNRMFNDASEIEKSFKEIQDKLNRIDGNLESDKNSPENSLNQEVLEQDVSVDENIVYDQNNFFDENLSDDNNLSQNVNQ